MCVSYCSTDIVWANSVEANLGAFINLVTIDCGDISLLQIICSSINKGGLTEALLRINQYDGFCRSTGKPK